MTTETQGKPETAESSRSVGVKVLVSVMPLLFYMIPFMVVWLALCAIADYVLLLDADAWRMAYGYVAGTCAHFIGATAEKNYSR